MVFKHCDSKHIKQSLDIYRIKGVKRRIRKMEKRRMIIVN